MKCIKRRAAVKAERWTGKNSGQRRKSSGLRLGLELKVRIREKEERDRGKKPFIKSSFEDVGHEFYQTFTDYDDLLI